MRLQIKIILFLSAAIKIRMKIFLILLSLINLNLFFFLNASLCNAHRPHDAIFSLAISPEYTVDGELYVSVEHNYLLVLKSNNHGVSWNPHQAGMGTDKVSAMVYSQTYAIDRTIFLATIGGKLYKSFNGGTWQLVYGTSGVKISSLASSPSYNQDSTIFLGTFGNGIVKSTDGGVTWVNINNGLSNLNINHIVLSPFYSQDQTLFAGSQNGIFKSIDGGNSWIPIGGQNSISVKSISLSPNYSSDQLVVAGTYGYGVFISSDGGQNWIEANNGITDLKVTNIAISPTFPADNTLIAVSKDTGVFKSTDGGSLWVLLDYGLRKRTNQSENHFLSLSFSPDYMNDKTIFVGMFEGLFKSVDGGNSWHQLNVYQPQLTRSVDVSPNYISSPNIFYVTYGAGIYKSNDGGSTWEIKNSEFDYPFLFSVVYGPEQNVFAVAAGPTSNGHFYSSSDDGDTWNQTIIDPDEIFMPTINGIAISPNFLIDKTIFVGNRFFGRYALYKSIDGGLSFSPVSIGVHNVYPIAFSPNYTVDDTVYTGTEDGVYKSIDQGENWVSIGLSNTYVSSLKISSDNILYAGTCLNGLFKSVDGGILWSPINNGLPELSVANLEVSPNFVNDKTMFVATLSYGIYKSNNAGASWQYSDLLGNYIQGLKISPSYETDQTLFAGTWDGVYKSEDGGINWRLISSVVRYEENHESFVISGTWESIKYDGCSSSYIAYSTVPGSDVSFTFIGSAVRWIGAKGQNHGVALVYIDNVYKNTIDLYSDNLLLLQNIYTSAVLPSGIHNIRIEVGSPHTLNQKVLSVDAFDVFR